MKTELRIPLIKVRDKGYDNTEHIVGTDSHDNLYIDCSGGIQYYNLQNGEGTRYGDYEFLGEEIDVDLYPQIKFITFADLIDLCYDHLKHIELSKEEKEKLDKIIGRAFEEAFNEGE